MSIFFNFSDISWPRVAEDDLWRSLNVRDHWVTNSLVQLKVSPETATVLFKDDSNFFSREMDSWVRMAFCFMP